MNHLLRNWKKYITLVLGILIAGAAAMGYIPPAVAEWLKTILNTPITNGR